MPIYTRTGDKGTTGLFSGKRVKKDSSIIEAIGAVDELNSYLGIVISGLKIVSVRKELLIVQSYLFEVGALLANPKRKSKLELAKKANDFEASIDSMTRQLPILRNFILPGVGRSGSELQYARTLARRTERRLVSLRQKNLAEVLIYINRLSDLLLIMARFVNSKQKKKETIWSGRRETKELSMRAKRDRSGHG